MVEDQQRRRLGGRRTVVPSWDVAGRSGYRQVANPNVNLRTRKGQRYLSCLVPGGNWVLVDDQAVDADSSLPGQHQLQRGIQRVAVDRDRAAPGQQPLGAGRHPGKHLDTDVGGDALQPTGPTAGRRAL